MSDTINNCENQPYCGLTSATTSTHANFPLFITTDELAKWLNMSAARARQLLCSHGVQPVDLGRGRGRGLRWRTSAVIQFADMLHTEAQATQPRKRKAKAPFSVLGKSASELFAEFNGKNSINAAVCDGK